MTVEKLIERLLRQPMSATVAVCDLHEEQVRPVVEPTHSCPPVEFSEVAGAGVVVINGEGWVRNG